VAKFTGFDKVTVGGKDYLVVEKLSTTVGLCIPADAKDMVAPVVLDLLLDSEGQEAWIKDQVKKREAVKAAKQKDNVDKQLAAGVDSKEVVYLSDEQLEVGLPQIDITAWKKETTATKS
jgi:hypothetical protein